MSAHHELGPSAMPRWVRCPGSVIVSRQYPNETSEDAFLGTLTHALGELCLLTDTEPYEYIGLNLAQIHKAIAEATSPVEPEENQSDLFEHVIDQEKADAVNSYVEYCRAIMANCDEFFVETSISLNDWVEEVFGASDFAAITGSVLDVVDYKNGVGIKVDAFENWQTIGYGLGMYAELSLMYDIKTIRMTIVQPNLDHIDTWEISVDELLGFGEYLRERAELVYEEDAKKIPGLKQCQFCLHKNHCSELASHALTIAGENYTSLDQEFEAKRLDQLTNTEISKIYPNLALVINWANSMKKFVVAEFEAGRGLDDYKMVEGKRSRSWIDEDEAEKKMRNVGKLKKSDCYEQKLLSVAKTEKKLGQNHRLFTKHGFNIIRTMRNREVVPMNDPRPAILTVVSDDEFDDEDSLT